MRNQMVKRHAHHHAFWTIWSILNSFCIWSSVTYAHAQTHHAFFATPCLLRAASYDLHSDLPALYDFPSFYSCCGYNLVLDFNFTLMVTATNYQLSVATDLQVPGRTHHFFFATPCLLPAWSYDLHALYDFLYVLPSFYSWCGYNLVLDFNYVRVLWVLNNPIGLTPPGDVL
jgi:hypothetical protein